jgi:hypothetical protein
MKEVKKTKLLRAIETKLTGNREILSLGLTTIDVYNDIPLSHTPTRYADEYRIGVNIGSSVLIESDLHHSDRKAMLEYAKARIGNDIAEEIYGELRTKLVNLSMQLKYESRPDSITHQMVDELIEMITYG